MESSRCPLSSLASWRSPLVFLQCDGHRYVDAVLGSPQVQSPYLLLGTCLICRLTSHGWPIGTGAINMVAISARTVVRHHSDGQVHEQAILCILICHSGLRFSSALQKLQWTSWRSALTSILIGSHVVWTNCAFRVKGSFSKRVRLTRLLQNVMGLQFCFHALRN